ncbi:hypothetical protein FRC08_003465 [Ceratobasidium sp. 394]|nr:hypothetical protein FRC08_003465 [Ceratobasidium sp. 394]
MSQQPLPRPPERLRHRIEEIRLEPSTSKHSVSAKLLVDDTVISRLPIIEPGRLLRWNNVPPCDVHPGSRVIVRLYEKHYLGLTGPCIGSAEYIASTIMDQREISLVFQSCNFTARVIFLTPGPDQREAAKALSKAQVAEHQQRLLQKLGPIRSAIKTILDFGVAVAELHPAAKAAFAVCNQAWSKLEAQERCDASVESLIDGLSNVLPYVEVVEKTAKLAQLRKNIDALIKLIEDASWFIIMYKQDGRPVQTVKALIGSTAQEQVDKLVAKLQVLREEFDRGMSVQVLQTVDDTRQMVDLNGTRILLNKLDELKPIGRAQYDATRACMPGTRKDIIRDVIDWCHSPVVPDNSSRLLWLYGHAGLGKSAIATSVCERLDDEKLLAASFFCKRDDPERRDSHRVFTSIIHGLAVRHPPYGTAVATQLQQDISLCDSPMQKQYNKLVQDVLCNSTLEPPTLVFVILIDALDECGDQDARLQLLGCLQRMCGLVTWLRVVVTSRPDKDIEQAFHRTNQSAFSTRDVYQYNASDDIRAVIQTRLAGSRNARLLPEDATEQLTIRADGLFIWAQTACQFVLNSHNPRDRLRIVLSTDDKSIRSTSALDSLYTTAIRASMADDGEDNAQLVQECLGAIIVCSTRAPLSVVTLSALLGERVEMGVLQSVVDSLGSVLYTDLNQDGVVRVYHPSFADFMITPARSGIYCVDMEQQNTTMAASCMRTMMAELRFNICGLEASYMRNQHVLDLAIRVKTCISGQLEYSCLYWVSHLVQSETTKGTAPDELALSDILTGPPVLYWIEVLSLKGKLKQALASLRDLRYWCKEQTLREYAIDVERFVQILYDPISTSTPHLYVSGLAFLPTGSAMSKIRDEHFPNTIQISHGRTQVWPAWLRCMSHSSSVYCVAASPDGHRIVSGLSNGTVQVWDADTGLAALDPLIGHSDSVWSVAFSPNSHRIVSGSDDNTIRIWDAETGIATTRPLVGHSNSVYSVSFSSDGCQIISGSRDTTIRVWDASTGALVRILDGHLQIVWCIAVSSDGHHIASGSGDNASEQQDNTVRVWSAKTGAIIREFVGHTGAVYSVVFSPDGYHIVSSSHDRTIRVWDIRSDTKNGYLLDGHTSRVCSVAFSPNGQHIISGSWDCSLRIWTLDGSGAFGNPLVGHTDAVLSVSYSPNGRIISGSLDGTVRVWDIDILGALAGAPATSENPSAEHKSPNAGHTNLVSSVSFAPDGRRIASAAQDGTVRIWDVDTGAAVGDPLVNPSGYVSSAAFSPDGDRIVSVSQDDTVIIWDINTGAEIGRLAGQAPAELEPVDDLSEWAHFMAYEVWSRLRSTKPSIYFSPNGQRIASTLSDGAVRVWDANTGAMLIHGLRGGISGPITSLAFSPNSHLLVTGSTDGTMKVRDAETGAAIGEPFDRYLGAVSSVAFSLDGRQLVSGSRNGTVRVWDIYTRTVVRTLQGHSSDVFSVAFSADGRRVVSGSGDSTARIWNIDLFGDSTISYSLDGHTDSVRSVAFSPDDRYIASGSDDGTIRVWDADPSGPPVRYLIDNVLPPRLRAHASLSDRSSSNAWRLTQCRRPDGWLFTSDGCDLLLWLPLEYCRYRKDDSLLVISPNSEESDPLWLDCSKFVHGIKWTDVFAPAT